MERIEAVIFDLDGVIVSTDEYHYLAWQKLADQEGVYFDRKINDRLRGVSRMESLEILLEQTDKPYSAEEKAEMAARKNEIYKDYLQYLTPEDILPGVMDLLHELKTGGIQTAIASSSKNAQTILEKVGLQRCFDSIVDGNNIRNSKPDPEVFVKAAAALKVPVNSCLVVEDATSGISAALAANMKVLAVGFAAGDLRAHLSAPDLAYITAGELLTVPAGIGNARIVTLADLENQKLQYQTKGAFVEHALIHDAHGSAIHVVTVHNGMLMFTILPNRGMDIGDLFLDGEKTSWERSMDYLLHPDHVDLAEDHHTGWEKGFYPAVTSIGPEIFGTPDEVRTMHGTASYSSASQDSVFISMNDEGITVEGTIPVKGYLEHSIYEKKRKIWTRFGSTSVVIHEQITNLTTERQPLDDGYHIQLAGEFCSRGGRYVLPVPEQELLLRDSASREEDPFSIYDAGTALEPIRCYQYVPKPVEGLDSLRELQNELCSLPDTGRLTAEMIVNSSRDTAAYVVRSLTHYPRSLIAKRATGSVGMYALEPCKTRPNSMKQKTIDGETDFLEPYESRSQWIMIGYTKESYLIAGLEQKINNLR